MDKALEMGKSSATGSFHLLLGVAGSTIIMAVGTLILTALLPAEGVGLYGMALIPASIINFFRDWGVNSALTQRIAGLRAAGKQAEIRDLIVSGVVFEIITGAVLALICFALAWPLAFILSPENVSNLSIYIAITSLSVFAGAIAAAAGGIFIGYERMKLNSFTQIFSAIIKTALGPLLIVLGFGVLGAVYAATVAIIAGAVLSILIVYFALFRSLRKCKAGKCDIKATLKPMLSYGLPLTVSSIMIGVLPLLLTFIMAIYAGTYMMGNYYAGSYFAVLLTFVSLPITTALFPMFSKIDPQKEPKLVKTVFASSVKYTALLLVPATMILITLATPLVNTLFPRDGIQQSLFVAFAAPKFPYAPQFLVLTVLVNLLVLIGNVSLVVFQSGIGKTRQIMWQSILSLLVGLPVAYLLIVCLAPFGPEYAVVGGVIGALVANTPGMVWGLAWIWKNYSAKADFLASAKILAASVIASAVTFLFISLVNLSYWVLMLAVGFGVFVLVFLVVAPLLGAVNRMDIDNFRTMFSGLGVVSKILNFPLLFMRRICKATSEERNSPDRSVLQ